MSLTLRTTEGCTEAVISDDTSLNRFYQIADILSDYFKINFIAKEDDFDSIYWSFSFHKHLLTLSYNIYNGICLFPTRTKDAPKKDNRAVVELANVLEGKLQNADLKK